MPTPGSVAAALDPAAPAPYKQGREFVQRVILTLTDNYVTGGVTVNMRGLGVPGDNLPFKVDFYETNGADIYAYVPGTNRSDGKLYAKAGSTEHTSDAAWAEASIKAEFRYKIPA